MLTFDALHRVSFSDLSTSSQVNHYAISKQAPDIRACRRNRIIVNVVHMIKLMPRFWKCLGQARCDVQLPKQSLAQYWMSAGVVAGGSHAQLP